MSLISIKQSCLDRAAGLSPAAGGAILLSFLLGAYYWNNLLQFPYSPVSFRLVFLTVILSATKFRLAIPVQEMVGRLQPPARANLRFVALALIAVLIVRLLVKLWIRSIDPDYDYERLTVGTFLDECVLAPLSEEAVFRGILLTALCGIFRKKLALIVVFSSLIFSAVHNVHFPPQQLGTFLFGAITCLVSLQARSLTTCIFLHAVSNSFIFF